MDRQARPRSRHGASSRRCRPTSAGSRSMSSPAIGSSTRCACTLRATEDRFEQQLKPIFGSELSNELGKRPFARSCRRSARARWKTSAPASTGLPANMAWNIVDVRIKKTDLPTARRSNSAFERMRTARLAGSALDPCRRARSGRRSSSARGRCRSGAHLCRELRQGPGILRFLPRDAVLPDDLPARRPGASRANQDYSVAEERLSEGIYWTLALSSALFNSRSCA